MAEKLIEVKNLKKYYNGGEVKALDGISVDICKGDVIAVIGPSGGGKSTFLRSLNLLEKPRSPGKRSTCRGIARKWAWFSSILTSFRTKRSCKI